MKNTGKRHPPLVKSQALVLFSTGMSYNKIGKILGVTRSMVRLWCNREAHEGKKRRDREQYERLKEEDPEGYRDYHRQWRADNLEHCREYAKAYSAKWRADNPERNLENSRRHRMKHRDSLNAQGRVYRRNNRDKMRVHWAKRRAAEMQAVPPWITPEQKQKEREIYAEAVRLSEETGICYHVDHIWPLRCKKRVGGVLTDYCCGLHVHWNMRAIPGHENRAKWSNYPENESPTAW